MLDVNRQVVRRRRQRFLACARVAYFLCMNKSDLKKGRLLDRKLNHRRLNLGRHPVLQQRLAPADLLQRQLAALLVQLLEAVEAVARVAQHLAGLAHIAELLGQLQQPDLPSNDFLVLGHGV